MSTLVESWISWFVASIFGLGRAVVLCVKHVGWLDGLLGVAGGCWDDKLTSDEMD